MTVVASTSPAPAAAPLSILLVEDSLTDARLVQECLRDAIRAGTIVLQTARRLNEATAQLRRASVSCVLLDLGLPDGKGLRNIEEVRAVDRCCAIIVMTGLDSAQSALKAVELGAQDYLVKGHYEEADLLRFVRRAVERAAGPAAALAARAS